MPLTEKELERYLWEQPAACQAQGLTINYDFFGPGRRYQQLSLGPYGVAQQVSVRFWPAQQCYYAQVLVFSTGIINPVFYLKAKRQLSALRQLLERTLKASGLTARVVVSCVLIGRQVQRTGDFVFALNLDTTCQAFTYRYDVEGVHFLNVGKSWHIEGSEQAPALTALATDLLAERTDALRLSHEQRTAWLASATTQPGELAEGLVITTEGIITSSALEGEGEAYE